MRKVKLVLMFGLLLGILSSWALSDFGSEPSASEYPKNMRQYGWSPTDLKEYYSDVYDAYHKYSEEVEALRQDPLILEKRMAIDESKPKEAYYTRLGMLALGVVNEHRRIAMLYLNETPLPMRDRILAANKDVYGDEYGYTYSNLVSKGYTAEDILDRAMKPNWGVTGGPWARLLRNMVTDTFEGLKTAAQEIF